MPVRAACAGLNPHAGYLHLRAAVAAKIFAFGGPPIPTAAAEPFLSFVLFLIDVSPPFGFLPAPWQFSVRGARSTFDWPP